jgi:hypothetical protein
MSEAIRPWPLVGVVTNQVWEALVSGMLPG